MAACSLRPSSPAGRLPCIIQASGLAGSLTRAYRAYYRQVSRGAEFYFACILCPAARKRAYPVTGRFLLVGGPIACNQSVSLLCKSWLGGFDLLSLGDGFFSAVSPIIGFSIPWKSRGAFKRERAPSWDGALNFCAAFGCLGIADLEVSGQSVSFLEADPCSLFQAIAALPVPSSLSLERHAGRISVRRSG